VQARIPVRTARTARTSAGGHFPYPCNSLPVTSHISYALLSFIYKNFKGLNIQTQLYKEGEKLTENRIGSGIRIERNSQNLGRQGTGGAPSVLSVLRVLLGIESLQANLQKRFKLTITGYLLTYTFNRAFAAPYRIQPMPLTHSKGKYL